MQRQALETAEKTAMKNRPMMNPVTQSWLIRQEGASKGVAAGRWTGVRTLFSMCGLRYQYQYPSPIRNGEPWPPIQRPRIRICTLIRPQVISIHNGTLDR